jgi:hypothetical protein
MRHRFLPIARVTGIALTALTAVTPAPHSHGADLSLPLAGRSAYTLEGPVRSVDGGRNRLTVLGDGDRAYAVDTYVAYVFLQGTGRIGLTGDLKRDMWVEVRGTRLGQDQVEARSVRVLPGGIQIDGVVQGGGAGRVTVADGDGRRYAVDTRAA